jgi:hypothetical protein
MGLMDTPKGMRLQTPDSAPQAYSGNRQPRECGVEKQWA